MAKTESMPPVFDGSGSCRQFFQDYDAWFDRQGVLPNLKPVALRNLALKGPVKQWMRCVAPREVRQDYELLKARLLEMYPEVLESGEKDGNKSQDNVMAEQLGSNPVEIEPVKSENAISDSSISHFKPKKREENSINGIKVSSPPPSHDSITNTPRTEMRTAVGCRQEVTWYNGVEIMHITLGLVPKKIVDTGNLHYQENHARSTWCICATRPEKVMGGFQQSRFIEEKVLHFIASQTSAYLQIDEILPFVQSQEQPSVEMKTRYRGKKLRGAEKSMHKKTVLGYYNDEVSVHLVNCEVLWNACYYGLWYLQGSYNFPTGLILVPCCNPYGVFFLLMGLSYVYY